jgi:hypothetical protein
MPWRAYFELSCNCRAAAVSSFAGQKIYDIFLSRSISAKHENLAARETFRQASCRP